MATLPSGTAPTIVRFRGRTGTPAPADPDAGATPPPRPRPRSGLPVVVLTAGEQEERPRRGGLARELTVLNRIVATQALDANRIANVIVKNDEADSRANAAALFAIAIGYRGGFSLSQEGGWFKAARYRFLRDVTAAEEEDFVEAMLDARPQDTESYLVREATEDDLHFIYRVAKITEQALPPPSPDRDTAAVD